MWCVYQCVSCYAAFPSEDRIKRGTTSVCPSSVMWLWLSQNREGVETSDLMETALDKSNYGSKFEV